MNKTIDPLKIIADDKSLITYRPALNKITKSVIGTILLQQILYWHDKSKGKFYKFKAPCNHKDYREGDSWTEELGFNKSEFDRALKCIGCQKKSDKAISLLDEDALNEYQEKYNSAFVIYWTDMDRKTWYIIQEYNLRKSICAIYENLDVRHTEIDTPDLRESDIQISLLTETNKTETNTENITGEIERAPAQGKFIPPTLEQLQGCFLKNKLRESESLKQSKLFLAHYNSNGWMVGNNKMADWTSCVFNWIDRIGYFDKTKNGSNQETQDYTWINKYDKPMMTKLNDIMHKTYLAENRIPGEAECLQLLS